MQNNPIQKLSLGLATSVAVAALSCGTAISQNESDNLRALVESREVPVSVDNFIRAATEIEMGKYLGMSGGVNRLFHIRQPTRIDQQPTIRMNRDTLYSMAVIDISEGATLTIPETGDRCVTAMIVNQDHYINDVFLGGGTYTLDMETFDTPYVVAVFRMLVDASDPADVAMVNTLQDEITLEAGSSKPFILPHYDDDSFEATLKAAIELGRSVPDSTRTFGSRDMVDPIRHFLGTAMGWGGLPEEEAFYLNIDPVLPVGAYKIEAPAGVPVEASGL